jgi:hypothetical protein
MIPVVKIWVDSFIVGKKIKTSCIYNCNFRPIFRISRAQGGRSTFKAFVGGETPPTTLDKQDPLVGTISVAFPHVVAWG